MTNQQKARELVKQMTLEEKASLLAGADFWHLKSIERLGLGSIMVADGPHGLRKQRNALDSVGATGSEAATCFPPACASACSFNRGLLADIGRAIGEECRYEEVAVDLGPGMNIKRSPLCGRNFEYFSEDPYLAGELAAAYIEGLQSQNVGASLKHFAINNQETRRMTVDAIVDERAMREIYLAGFERAVKQARPWTVMCSYNRLYGTHASESKLLLTDILREEWGYEGLVVSDWGAVNDRVTGVRAGLDLEMPGTSRENDRILAAAVRDGALSEDELDACALRVAELIQKAQRRKPLADHREAHHALARRGARESAVLLKNDGNLLPGHSGQSAAVIGAFAKEPRYQGSGSSKINPYRLDNAFEELTALGLQFEYAPGYPLHNSAPDEALIDEACRIAKDKDIVYLFAGLPDEYESEGFDRVSLAMPAAHTELIRRVAAVNPNLVVILSCGSVVEMDWADEVPAILLGYLSGQAGAGAIADLLLGRYSPSGKLAESWPFQLEDTPAYAYFPGGSASVQHRESIYVGYRYYDTAKQLVRYPFGYGLSYTSFACENLKIDGMQVSLDVVNTGGRDGAEIVQLYVAPPASAIYKAAQELKSFEKVTLRAGERQRLSFSLSERDFAFYDVNASAWRVEPGDYEIRLSASSRDIRLMGLIHVEANCAFDTPVPDYRGDAPCYYELSNGIDVPDEAFLAVYGAPLPPLDRVPGTPHTPNSTFTDIQDRAFGRFLARIGQRITAKMFSGEEAVLDVEPLLGNLPLRALLMLDGKHVTHGMVEGIAMMINGRFFRGLGRMTKRVK